MTTIVAKAFGAAIIVAAGFAPIALAAPTHAAPVPGSVAVKYYKNCTEARKDGAAPIREGEDGYSSKLDRDGDGIACEATS
ncbi:MAG TPA: excalibur calcium-binding domain-containing protein [Gordonia sp. (in: high G+C Gram-positive bacteria)]|uniref:excalibur calcium-binding domain-containing protein n=1 Tax=unclassified Gordonia (in: high G+C Gram-positive bacteria) TaxID=2657482 RepID=UPI000FB204E6|nr:MULTISPECIES: excalibur calcium-binding domain-containing protein [unclassified Gordonia (in: high G+C Gram-positive bacteria)]RUP41555.1 MAG: excalibur calcium-binding domain-containing protein [Gordonia sp. (in: high G+C Gram-positive bacteria)]HNP56644.1 excalibur calcium-binding domain-containing protein [Gordonia sp. (in: high G+C Gram-positive bacteria)]HRC50314.1 excalibur calcium-binding domain-containing protein [Gordonia sp. (in: high G+C Gram-positive bacteria)]